MTKTIELSQGKIALVDDGEFEYLSKWKWYAVRAATGSYYAQAWVRQTDGTRRTVQMQRLVMDAETGQHVDHINGNGLDNRRSNLRIASHRQNHQNRRKMAGTSSRFKGVYWYKRCGKWATHIKIHGRVKHLGYFADEIAAALAYDAAARENFGEFACLNFPMPTEQGAIQMHMENG